MKPDNDGLFQNSKGIFFQIWLFWVSISNFRSFALFFVAQLESNFQAGRLFDNWSFSIYLGGGESAGPGPKRGQYLEDHPS